MIGRAPERANMATLRSPAVIRAANISWAKSSAGTLSPSPVRTCTFCEVYMIYYMDLLSRFCENLWIFVNSPNVVELCLSYDLQKSWNCVCLMTSWNCVCLMNSKSSGNVYVLWTLKVLEICTSYGTDCVLDFKFCGKLSILWLGKSVPAKTWILCKTAIQILPKCWGL